MQDELVSSTETIRVYKTPNKESELIAELSKFQVFSTAESELDSNEWLYVELPVNTTYKMGIEDYDKLGYGYVIKNNVILIDSLQKAKSFPILEFKVKSAADLNSKLNSPIINYGLEIPLEDSYYVTEMILKWNNSIAIQDKYLYEDLFNMAFAESIILSSENNRVRNYCYDDIYFIKQNCADGAGSYEVTWVIKDGTIIQRLIDEI